MAKSTIFSIISLFSFSALLAQVPEKDSISIQDSLKMVTVTATRLQSELETATVSVTKINPLPQRNSFQQLTPDEWFYNVPGLFITSSNNFAQDLRLSLRGFGARSAFGIRGVKVLVDGIPESTPDGQTQLDNIPVSWIEEVEVIRGLAGGLYGNASGGVIAMKTKDLEDSSFVKGRISAGAYGFQQYQLEGGVRLPSADVQIGGNYTTLDGYRDWSAHDAIQLNNKITFNLSEEDKLRVIINYTNSDSKDPGALAAPIEDERRTDAWERNVAFEAQEEVRQLKVGLILEEKIDARQMLELKAYYQFRDFENKLPFENGGIVEFRRHFGGFGTNYELNTRFLGKSFRVKAGFDLEYQEDDRSRYFNNQGEKGEATFDQIESFFNSGLFAFAKWNVHERFWVDLSARTDFIYLEAQDYFLEDGKDSGERFYNQFNPILGLNYKLSEAVRVFTNFSRGFETPTLNELSANPTGRGGFNPDLEPQQSWSSDIGLRLRKKRIRFEAVFFYIESTNETVPFELSDEPGRVFYQNTGETRRTGLETSLNMALSSQLQFNAHYTFSDFTFHRFDDGEKDFSGNALPGIPEHQAFGALIYQSQNGFYGIVQMRYAGSLFLNNANAAQDNAYWVGNLRLGYKKELSGWSFEPFLGLNNFLNTYYNNNIRINAFGQRYFEPAPERHLYAGISIKIR